MEHEEKGEQKERRKRGEREEKEQITVEGEQAPVVEERAVEEEIILTEQSSIPEDSEIKSTRDEVPDLPDSNGNSDLLPNYNKQLVDVQLALEIAEKLIHNPGHVNMDTPPLTPEVTEEAKSGSLSPKPIAQASSEFFV